MRKERTLGQKFLQRFGSFLVHFIDRAFDLSGHPSHSRCRLLRDTLSIPTRNLLEYLDETCLLANRITIQFGHVWTDGSFHQWVLTQRSVLMKFLRSSPFHMAQEPPLSEVFNDRDDEYELVAADK